jgi:hypothetical protein
MYTKHEEFYRFFQGDILRDISCLESIDEGDSKLSVKERDL